MLVFVVAVAILNGVKNTAILAGQVELLLKMLKNGVRISVN